MTNLSPNSVLKCGSMKMPVIGLGTWLCTDEEANRAICASLDIGYRHFDTAFAYFNEEAIGRVLERLIKEGKIRREDVFIVTKLPSKAISPDKVELLIKQSLKALRTDYIDLYLIHTPMGFKYDEEKTILPMDDKGELLIDPTTDLVAVWKEMEKQVVAGRAKSIGVSNFNIQQMDKILKNCTIPPTNNQIEMHIYLQQKEIIDYCNKNNITVCAYAPLGSPSLVSWKKSTGLPLEGSTGDLSPLDDPVVGEIAKQHGKKPGQVLLRFLLQLGVAVIPKSTNPSRIKENFEIFDFELTESDMEKLKTLDKGEAGRINYFKGSEKHPEYPFKK